MRLLSESEKKILADGAYNQFWHLMSEILQAAIHEEAVNQLQTNASDSMTIQKFKSRREALEEVLKMPLEMSK